MSADTTIDKVLTVVEGTQKDVAKIEQHLKELNGCVRANQTAIAVLNDWRTSAAQPCLAQTVENRVNISKLVTQVGGLGGIVSIIVVALKAFGAI
jgi:hypothetical protein